jgi:hypothetical protein
MRFIVSINWYFFQQSISIFLLCRSQVVAVFVVAMCAIALAQEAAPEKPAAPAAPAAKPVDKSVEAPKDTKTADASKPEVAAAAPGTKTGGKKGSKKTAKADKKTAKKAAKKSGKKAARKVKPSADSAPAPKA